MKPNLFYLKLQDNPSRDCTLTPEVLEFLKSKANTLHGVKNAKGEFIVCMWVTDPNCLKTFSVVSK